MSSEADFSEGRLTPAQAAAFIGLAPHTLAVDRCNGRLGSIPFYKVGGRVFYTKADLVIWVAGRRVPPPTGDR